MKIFIVFVFFIISLFKLSFSACVYKPNFDHTNFPDIILQPFGNVTLMLTQVSPSYFISNDEFIELFCNQEFKIKRSKPIPYYDHYTNGDSSEEASYSYDVPSNAIVKIKCIGSEILHEINETNEKDIASLTCSKSDSSFFLKNIQYCYKSGFLYGIAFKNTSIVFAEFCYDIRKSNIIFIRYSAVNRSPIFEEQELYNPSKINSKLDGLQKFVFPPRQANDRSLDAPYDNEFNFTTYSGSAKFEIGELVNFEKYAKLFKIFLGDISEINSIIWWSPLKNGNWKVYERLLENEAFEYDLDIFAGKSGVVTYPYNEKCTMNTELQIDVYGSKKSVPLFVWNYIRSRDIELGQHNVVILGVNSPFFEGENSNVTKICNDICDETPWLNSLSKTRKMAAFGFIFCCKPEEVKFVLDGFPNIIQEEYSAQTKPTNER